MDSSSASRRFEPKEEREPCEAKLLQQNGLGLPVGDSLPRKRCREIKPRRARECERVHRVDSLFRQAISDLLRKTVDHGKGKRLTPVLHRFHPEHGSPPAASTGRARGGRAGRRPTPLREPSRGFRCSTTARRSRRRQRKSTSRDSRRRTCACSRRVAPSGPRLVRNRGGSKRPRPRPRRPLGRPPPGSTNRSPGPSRTPISRGSRETPKSSRGGRRGDRSGEFETTPSASLVGPPPTLLDRISSRAAAGRQARSPSECPTRESSTSNWPRRTRVRSEENSPGRRAPRRGGRDPARASAHVPACTDTARRSPKSSRRCVGFLAIPRRQGARRSALE